MSAFKVIKLFDKRTFLFYCLAGGLSALVYFCFFSLLWQMIHMNYKIAVSIAYVMSVVVHFTMNRRLTFRGHGKNLRKHLMKYSVMILINYLITMLVVHMVVEKIHLSPYFGVVAAIGATVMSGYLMAKYWVFKTGVFSQ